MTGGSASSWPISPASRRWSGVADGLHKAEAILGALHGGFLDVLVTNELVAIRLLELERALRSGALPA
jgi:DNA-binding transcriptional regulator LsrR (DeoR family)